MDILASPFELKSINDAGHIEGLAAAFGNVDQGGDRIMHGAFTKTLAARGAAPLPMLLYHKLDRPVGAWTDLKETPEGLLATGKLTLDSRNGADAHALVRSGALRGLSIGFNTTRKSYDGPVRQVHEADLHEISLTPVGMNNRATVRTVKSVASVADLREILQDHGFSGREAKAMAGAAWKVRSDAEDDRDADEHAAMAAIIEASAARMAALRGR